MEELTKRQQEVLELIQQALHQGEGFPSLRNLAAKMGISSPKGVSDHLKALEKKGFLTPSTPNQGAYQLADEYAVNEHSFPLSYGLAAGVPKPAFDAEDSVHFNPSYFGGGELFAVVISGESMSGDGINDGDTAIIKEQRFYQAKDIMAVRIQNDEATLKRIRKVNQFIELISSNIDFPPRQVAAADVEIIGKLVGVVKRF